MSRVAWRGRVDSPLFPPATPAVIGPFVLRVLRRRRPQDDDAFVEAGASELESKTAKYLAIGDAFWLVNYPPG